MQDVVLFTEEEEKKVLYGKFKNLYIPLINKKIISKSLELDNDNSLRNRINKKFIITSTKFINTKIMFKEVKKLALNTYINECFKKINGYKYSVIYAGMENISEYYTIELIDENGMELGYAKIPQKTQCNKSIFREIEVLKYLETLNLQSANIPKVLYYDECHNIFIQSTKSNLKKDKGNIDIKHINFLSELYEKTNEICEFKESRFYNHLINIKNKTSNEYLIELSNKILNKISIDKIQGCYCHGDFYISNIKWYNDNLFVYDWDGADTRAVYYDLFHYIASEDIINKKIKKITIINNILKDNKYIELYETTNNINKDIRVSMFIYYLYEVIYEFAVEMKLDITKDIILINYIEIMNIVLDNM